MNVRAAGGHLAGHAAADRQRGATALEFAFVFPLMFLLLYGILVYAYIFLISESMTFVAQEAAEAAVAVDPDDNPGYEAQVRTRAQQTAATLLQWLPSAQRDRVVGTSGEKVVVSITPADGQQYVRVQLEFSMISPTNLFPSVTLPLVGQAPPMPEVLRAEASALVDPAPPEDT